MAKPKAKTPYRKHGEGSIRMRPNGLWIARVDRTIDGVRKPIQITGMDYDTVLAKFDKAKQQMREYGYVADPNITVAAWVERWLTEIAKPKLRPDTWGSYASLLRRWVIRAIGDKKLAGLIPADIRGVRNLMAAGIPTEGIASTSSSTSLKCYRVLSKCLDDARREGLVTQNVADRVDPPRKAISAKGSFTVDQVRELLRTAAAATDPDQSRQIFALLTGIRQSEALSLTLDHLDLDGGVAEIEWQLQEIPWEHGCGDEPCGYKQAARCPAQVRRVPEGYDYRMLEGNFALVPTKTRGSARQIPLLPPVVAALRQHLADTAGHPNPHSLVWRRPDGSPIPHKVDQEEWRSLVTSIGLPRTCTTHWARHSVATLLLEAGVDAKVVGEIVGHGSTAITREVYQHVTSQLARQGMTALDALLNPPAAAAAPLALPGGAGS